MDNEPQDLNMFLQETFNNWVDQGVLTSEKSAQLQGQIRRLARQDRKTCVARRIYSLALAIATCLWLLFVNCPVAAASYTEIYYSSAHSTTLGAIILLAVLAGYFVKQTVHQPIGDSIGGAHYEY